MSAELLAPDQALAQHQEDQHELAPLRVVDHRGKRRKARRLRAAIWAAGATAAVLVFGAVAFHVFLAQSQVRLDHLNKTIGDAQKEFELARLQVAQASAPATIIDRAHQLGMVEPDHVNYVSAPSPPADNASRARAWVAVKPYLAPQP
jgi:cell division protein FtsL